MEKRTYITKAPMVCMEVPIYIGIYICTCSMPFTTMSQFSTSYTQVTC